MRETPETYYLELEELRNAFNGKHILNLSEVSKYLGKTSDWCIKHLNLSKDGVSIVLLAYKLSAMTVPKKYY